MLLHSSYECVQVFFHSWHTGGEDEIFTLIVCMAVILESAILDFSVTVEVSFCGCIFGQYLWDVSSPLRVQCLVLIRPRLKGEVWLRCSSTSCPALPACTPCYPWRQWLVSSPELLWVRAWHFSVNQMWTNLPWSGHSSSVTAFCKPDGIDVAVVQSLSFGDAGTALASVCQYRQPDRPLLNQ